MSAQMHGLEASGTRMPEDWFFESVAGRESAAGIAVSPRSVLAHPWVWQAVKILTGDIGQLPVHKMRRRMVDGKEYIEKDMRHAVHQCLNYGPNDYQTPSQWKETVMHDALLYGNHVSQVSRQADGRIILTPLPPQGLSYIQTELGRFYIRANWNGRQVTIPYDEVFHIRGLASAGNDGCDGSYQASGFWGLPVIAILRNALGSGLAMIEYGAALFKNNARPGGVLKFPGPYNAEAARNLRKEWQEIHGGSRNAGKVAVLYEDGQFVPIAMTNDEAQLLDLRRLDREIVASAFNLPPYKLGGLENSAVRANVAEQNRDYITRTITYWTNKLSEEINRKLFRYREQTSERHFVRWDFSKFLESDIDARFAAYSTAITSRILNPNEVRQKEGLNPYEGGDEFTNPAIDTAASRESESPESEEQEEDSADMESRRKLIVQLVTAMLRAEKGMLTAALNRGDEFRDYAADFYSVGRYEAFVEKFLGVAMEMWPLNYDAVRNRQHQNSASLQNILDLHPVDAWKHAAGDLIASIPDESQVLADELMEQING